MGRLIVDRLTKCNTGQRFNFFMHVFMFITLAFSIGMLIGTPSVVATALYVETAQVSASAVNIWGLIGLITVALHTVGMLIRQKLGIELLRVATFGGFYLWLWATIVYFSGGFYFEFFVIAVPNIAFWVWYAWQWRRRYKHPTSTTVAAFV